MADALIFLFRWIAATGLILVVDKASGQSTSTCLPTFLKATESLTVKLPCKLQPPGTHEVYWTKDGSVISNGKNMLPGSAQLSIDYYYMYDRNLVIAEPRRGLAGVYKCRNRTTSDVVRCYSVTYVPDVVEDEPVTSPSLPILRRVEVSAGGTVDLWCNVTSDTAKWYMAVDDTSEEDIGIVGRKLQIRDISVHCGSRYVCKDGEDVHCICDLNISRVAVFVEQIKRDKDVTLVCKTEGDVQTIKRMQWVLLKDKKDENTENATFITDGELVHNRFGQFYNLSVTKDANNVIIMSNLSFQAKKSRQGSYRCEVRIQDTSGSGDLRTVKSQSFEVT